MKKAGWKVYHVPHAEIYHYQGKSAEIQKKRARVEYYWSRYLFFKKNRGRFQWVLLLIGSVIRLGIQLSGMTLACLFTLFRIERWREKFLLSLYLMAWHLRGCPKGMGLKEIK
jgi:GT2 family glycosyltransferase